VRACTGIFCQFLPAFQANERLCLPSFYDISWQKPVEIAVAASDRTTRIDTLLKLSVIVSLLIGSSGAGYYYALYLPQRNAELDQQHLSEQLQAYGHRRTEEARLLTQQQQTEQRRAADKAAAESRYQTCLARAGATHDSSWSTQCKVLADQVAQNHTACLASGKLSASYCDAAYRTRDGSPNCSLPLKVSTGLDGDITAARQRCLQERDAALQ
jgi:hypothetical protein